MLLLDSTRVPDSRIVYQGRGWQEQLSTWKELAPASSGSACYYVSMWESQFVSGMEEMQEKHTGLPFCSSQKLLLNDPWLENDQTDLHSVQWCWKELKATQTYPNVRVTFEPQAVHLNVVPHWRLPWGSVFKSWRKATSHYKGQTHCLAL